MSLATGVLWQNMPVIALENSVFDGVDTVAEIRRHGNHGVGTWDQLNGEGLIVDGTFYQIQSDGTVHTPPDSAVMPWAAICEFEAESTIELASTLTYEELPAFLDPNLPTANCYYALRVEGRFDSVTTRSLPKQQKPYPPLAPIERTQPEFSFTEVEGIMVGFRSPPYVTNVSPPNYHLHFIKSDRSGGGHVLSFSVDEARLSMQRLATLTQAFPDYPEFNDANLAEAQA